MMLTRTLTVLIVTLALAPAALAQNREVSDRERAYGRRLAGVLSRSDSEAGTVTRTSVQLNPSLPLPSGARGIRVDLGRDLEVTRLRFRTPEDAQQLVADLLRAHPSVPLVAELRGDQVVVARGVTLNDPDMARRVRLAVWEGLPAPGDVTDASLTRLETGTALSTRLKDGPLFNFIDVWNRSVRWRAGHNQEGYRAPDATQSFVDHHTGLTARVRDDADGASFWSASDLDGAVVVRAHFDALGGHPVTAQSVTAQSGPAPTPGMRKILDGLWTSAP